MPWPQDFRAPSACSLIQTANAAFRAGAVPMLSNVYVASRRTGERVMAMLRKLYSKLRLKVNETKSAVASVFSQRNLYPVILTGNHG